MMAPRKFRLSSLNYEYWRSDCFSYESSRFNLINPYIKTDSAHWVVSEKIRKISHQLEGRLSYAVCE